MPWPWRVPSPLPEVTTHAPPHRWQGVAFGLGGNIGDPAATIAAALTILSADPDIRIAAAASLYRTPPWGPVPQPDFANSCAIGQTRLTAPALLQRVKGIERDLGRIEGERWGPRAIDIDILCLGHAAISEPDLIIPHASLFARAFVLVPLAEIAPDLVIGGWRVIDARDALGPADIRLWA